MPVSESLLFAQTRPQTADYAVYVRKMATAVSRRIEVAAKVLAWQNLQR
jgi:hypothetical protein